MNMFNTSVRLFLLCSLSWLLCSCSSMSSFQPSSVKQKQQMATAGNYSSRVPAHLDTGGQKVVMIDPNVHAWGAYGSDGSLLRAGLATAGNSYCPDIHRACRTKSGTFHVNSLGSASCKSSIFPLPRGGAPMPYCMFFNGNQAMHGSYDVVEGNISHGCVRLQVSDAEWLRFNFVNIGTKVIVRPY